MMTISDKMEDNYKDTVKNIFLFIIVIVDMLDLLIFLL